MPFFNRSSARISGIGYKSIERRPCGPSILSRPSCAIRLRALASPSRSNIFPPVSGLAALPKSTAWSILSATTALIFFKRGTTIDAGRGRVDKIQNDNLAADRLRCRDDLLINCVEARCDPGACVSEQDLTPVQGAQESTRFIAGRPPARNWCRYP